MRSGIVVGLLAVATAASAASSAQAQGGDPIMRLSEVRPGMDCRAWSVLKGTDPDDFDVEILDVVGGEGGARLLVKVSGPEVDETGVGAGFSGSPVYCRGDDGVEKNAGAISETIGEYGGKTVLATPIEQILGVSTDPAPNRRRSAVPANARALATPISIRGLSNPLFAALQKAARRHGRTFIQAPPLSLRQSAPNPAGLRPGSAVSIGLSSGDLSVGAIGTVAYTAGDRVWTLGHPFDGVGRRSLFLSNAYVAAIIGNPVQLEQAGATYKLAGALNDVGTVTNDGFSAVAGKTGPLPPSVPVRIFTSDVGTPNSQVTTEVLVADETDVGNPTGSSALSFVGPLSITQAASEVLDSAPNRLMGTMCMRLVLRERPKAIRICNRYVADGTSPAAGGNIVALRAASDAAEILTLLDAYRPTPLHVTEMSARITLERGQHQAFMRKVTLPRRVRRGQKVTARMTVQLVRDRRTTIDVPVTIPRDIGRGRKRLTFRGSDPDTADDDLFGTLTIELGDPDDEDEDTEGPSTLKALLREIRALDRYDGIRMNNRRAFEHPDLRVGGRASTTVTVR